eukprot:CAMPEP_0117669990 /NCGR_PEP_ID=MMETSP0804-20121206/12468_1 /TAXON_ID=1074897 /ORGANISM="Tetraselmis astigmatica, Strain CCMP880" /LENGTH=304 /DNA_ID=CAMNT_0005478167 /DNA_START=66 /DNA_END=980 /DNA_ORIENTATION=+
MGISLLSQASSCSQRSATAFPDPHQPSMASRPLGWQPLDKVQPGLAPRRRFRQQVRHLQASSSSGSNLKDMFSKSVDAARQKAVDLDQEHKIREKVSGASKKAKETSEQLMDDLRRSVKEVDLKFDVSGNTKQAFESVKGGAKSIDTEYGISRRLKTLWTDIRRSWPVLRRQIAGFFATPIGRMSLFMAFFYSVYTGLFFKVLAYSVLIFWGLSFFGVPQRWLRRAVEEQQRRQQEAYGASYARQQQQQQAYGAGAYGPYGPGAFSQSQRTQGQSTSSSKQAGGTAGTTIDVEWSTVEEDRKER